MNPNHAAHRSSSSPPHPPPPMLHRRRRRWRRRPPRLPINPRAFAGRGCSGPPARDPPQRLPRHGVAAAAAGHPPHQPPRLPDPPPPLQPLQDRPLLLLLVRVLARLPPRPPHLPPHARHPRPCPPVRRRLAPPPPHRPTFPRALPHPRPPLHRRRHDPPGHPRLRRHVHLRRPRPRRGEFVYLLDTLAKYGYVKVAAEIFNKRKQRYDLDVKMYAVLVYGWCKVGRVDMAERFLREMIEKGLEPNAVCYNIILNGICRRSSLHPDDRFDRTVRAAERVFDEMRQRGIEPDVTSYSIVLHVYSRAHKPELSMVKLREMQGRGLCPTVATYTSVIKCLSSCGRLEEAEEMLEEMGRGGVSPSAMTYNCFFKEYRGRKDWGSALKLYRKMKESDGCSTVPSIHTFHIMLGMFLRLGKMDIVWELWEDMGKSGVGPDLDSYTMLVHWLCQMQKWRDACQFFVEMIEKGLLPQKTTFETLYKGLIQSDKLRTWRRLKKKLDEESLKFGLEFQQYHLQPYRR